jgi:hypothetical protein
MLQNFIILIYDLEESTTTDTHGLQLIAITQKML